jgi:hypothetical protein
MTRRPSGFSESRAVDSVRIGSCVLEKMPHRHEVEPLVTEVLLVEQPAPEVDAGERRTRAQVLEVDAGRPRAVAGAHLLEERPHRAADVEYVAPLVEPHESADDLVLLPIVPVHRPIEEAGERTVLLLSVRDVFRVS